MRQIETRGMPDARRTAPTKAWPKYVTRKDVLAMYTGIKGAVHELRRRDYERVHEDIGAPLRAEIEKLKSEVAQLRAEIGVKRDVDQLRQQVDTLRGGRLVDVTPEPRRATGARSA
jgi:hypothetical protein